MKRTALILAAVTLACATQLVAQACSPGSLGGATAIELNSIYRDRTYNFCVTFETIAQTPSWLEDDDFPPLSPREAIRTAKDELSALVTDSDNWTMTEIQLTPLMSKDIRGKWAYVVSFVGGAPPGPWVGTIPVSGFRIIVLMDGKAVKPHIYPLGH